MQTVYKEGGGGEGGVMRRMRKRGGEGWGEKGMRERNIGEKVVGGGGEQQKKFSRIG